MTPKYLYGLSVNSIQEFIFATGKLKEIIGASEFVEQVCGAKFIGAIQAHGTFKEENLLVAAAGRVVYVFEDEALCQAIFRTYLRDLKQVMPDISLTQACVSLSGQNVTGAMRELSSQLEAQRSQQGVSHGNGIMISSRSPRTGLPSAGKDHASPGAVQYLDRNQLTKQQYAKKNSLVDKVKTEGSRTNFPTDLNELVASEEEGWIAMIHVDGNNLGETIRSLYEFTDDDVPVAQSKIQDFSKKLNDATQAAVKRAFNQVVEPVVAGEDEARKYPFRPILIGGDDLSVVIRADLALDFTSAYLEAFEEETRRTFADFGLPDLENGLTACAGISYIKANYPMHYAMDLAEDLTKYAKKKAKNLRDSNGLAPSCLVFHKVHSSFVEEYSEVIDRVLTAGEVKLNFGPYFLNPDQVPTGYASIATLRERTMILNTPGAPRGSLREWLTILERRSLSEAEQLMKRICGQNAAYQHDLGLGPESLFVQRSAKNPDDTEKIQSYTHLYDVLSLATISKS